MMGLEKKLCETGAESVEYSYETFEKDKVG